MNKEQRMQQAVEQMIAIVEGLRRFGITAGDMPDDLISARSRLMTAAEHLQGRIQLARLRQAA